MKSHTKRRGTQARAYLLALVDRLKRAGCDALPPIRRIAIDAGVAPLTVSRALRQLAADGVLNVSPRVGVRISRPAVHLQPPTAAPIHQPAQSLDLLSSRIVTDVGNGLYVPGTPLPSYRELAQHYGASYRQVRQAFALLAAQGVLERSRRRFVVPDLPASTQPYAELVLITGSDNIGQLQVVTPRAPEFWRALERECLQRKVRLTKIDQGRAIGKTRWPDGRRARLPEWDRSRTAIGYLVWTVDLGAEELERVVGLAATTGKPVVMVHEQPNIPLSVVRSLARRHERVSAVHTAVSSQCGQEMGYYLRRLGHRSIAVFYPASLDPCWLARVEGLRAAYEAMGLPDAVHEYAPSAYRTTEELIQAMNASEITGALASFRKRLAKYDQVLVDDFAEDFNLFTNELALWRLFLQTTMAPQFRQAQAEKAATAWVGVSDLIAFGALSFLRKQARAVPRDISVAGFDDSIEAVGWDLTSYNFNMPALMSTAVSAVLGPHGGRQAGDKVLDIRGNIMVRGSTAAPVTIPPWNPLP